MDTQIENVQHETRRRSPRGSRGGKKTRKAQKQVGKTNILTVCSYYEFFLAFLKAYVGKYPSSKTAPLALEVKEFVGVRLFPEFGKNDVDSQKSALESLSAFIDFLNSENFGFYDNLGYLCDNIKGTDLSATAICRHLGSLFIADALLEKNHHKLTVKSDSDASFTLTLFARSTTAPQEAIDTFVLFKHSTNKKAPVMTTLGYKKRSDVLNIAFVNDDDDTDSSDDSAGGSADGQDASTSVPTQSGNDSKIVKKVLKIGLFGYIAGPGEHLEESEKKEIETVLAENAEAVAKNIPVKINRARKIIARSCDEEAGLNLDEHQDCSHWLIGVHNAPGRDKRYWTKTVVTSAGPVMFGYERPSTSVLFAVVVPCATMPTELPEPSDGAECAKNQIITFDDLVKNFSVGGKYNPAFSSHVENVAMLVKSGLHKL
ncbi:hypothetical protein YASMINEVIRUS_406 [Yasminevirus sp. GU-2018]|uniref:Uncharacterized protein n=1 Tax=Yasminevirus sp. GU-2018 TaxID=2420051 RepID=A0A5K0U9A0_9VIRU|nr:hypothetical protein YASMINEVIRUS_406 [Yasminevirus sp. GU-2018]